MINVFRKIQFKFHKFLLNKKKEKLELMTLNIINDTLDCDPLLKEGMWYSDIANMLVDLKDEGYIKEIGEGSDLTLRLTKKGKEKLNVKI